MTITFDAFMSKYSGRFVDVDHAFGAQCVDLANAYCMEVLGAPRLSGNAIDIWRTAPAARQRATNAPAKGTIVIWGANAIAGTGVYGHIAIAVEDQGVSTFSSLDQNFPTGSPCHLQRHTYDGVIGWLIPTGIAPPPAPAAGPPKDAADAVDTLRRHSAALTDLGERDERAARQGQDVAPLRRLRRRAWAHQIIRPRHGHRARTTGAAGAAIPSPVSSYMGVLG